MAIRTRSTEVIKSDFAPFIDYIAFHRSADVRAGSVTRPTALEAPAPLEPLLEWVFRLKYLTALTKPGIK